MNHILSFILIAFVTFPSAIFTQCYNISVSEISFDPDPILPVEENGMTTMTVIFCNEQDEVTNDTIGVTNIAICAYNLLATEPPFGSYASNFEWVRFLDCWFGTIPQGNTIPVGCGTIKLKYIVTKNSSRCSPKNKVLINLNPSSLISENVCNDSEDDSVCGTTYTQSSNQSIHVSGDALRYIIINYLLGI